MAVISDWESRLPTILAGLQITHYFSFVLASGSLGVAKPAPAFFQAATDLAEVTPTRAVMVGDSYYGDVGGARAAGLDAVLLDRDGTSSVTDVAIIRSLSELCNTLV